MKLSDFKGLFKKSVLTLISVKNPHGDYYEVALKPESSTKWNPGEHGIFKLPDNQVEGKKWRAFSVASVPEEGVVLIAKRTGSEVSSFKKELISMKKGDKVTMIGPFGWFKVQDASTPIVMLAGGVGITPIRALLKQLENDMSRPVELVYASSEFYLYQEELQAIADGNDKINLHKTDGVDQTNKVLGELLTQYKGDAFYYISGSKNFIGAIKTQITSTGVKGKRIINDPFLGY